MEYDIELIDPINKTTLNLEDLGLLSGENSIIYDVTNKKYPLDSNKSVTRLPSIFLPKNEKESLNILYGSCRKLHGDGLDSTVIGDKLISDNYFNIEKRPNVLFLIGDQIYADDVADPLIQSVTNLGNLVIGWEEYVHGIDQKLVDIPIAQRQELVESNAKFTSEEAKNHLMSFSEFVAMYLMAWNYENWPDVYPKPPLNKKSKLQARNYKKQIELLNKTRKNIRAFRRMLANIPTYMIFDDHEITDDWNIDGKWSLAVNKSKCGKQIITNGLVAYWAFQGWGNDPEIYDESFIKMIKKYLYLRREESNFFLKKPHSAINYSQFQEHHYNNLTKLESEICSCGLWSFVAPTKPISIFLDTRTQRDFHKFDGPPNLLNKNALDRILNFKFNNGFRLGEPLIIVSPTPVFGFELAERIQNFLSAISGTYKWDLETWRSNEEGFLKFMSFIIREFKSTYCIFISGDVHYGFNLSGEFSSSYMGQADNTQKNYYNFENQTIGSTFFTQLTSSPIKSNHLFKRIIVSYILNLIHKIIFPSTMLRKGIIKLNYSDDKVNKDENNENHLNINRKTNYSDLDPQLEREIIWSDSRSLVDLKGVKSSPILGNNNIGYIQYNRISHQINHVLYFIINNKVKGAKGFIDLGSKLNRIYSNK